MGIFTGVTWSANVRFERSAWSVSLFCAKLRGMFPWHVYKTTSLIKEEVVESNTGSVLLPETFEKASSSLQTKGAEVNSMYPLVTNKQLHYDDIFLQNGSPTSCAPLDLLQHLRASTPPESGSVASMYALHGRRTTTMVVCSVSPLCHYST